MKFHLTLMSMLVVGLLAPTFSEAAKIRTTGAYSDYNPQYSTVSKVVTASCGGNEAVTGGGCVCSGPHTNSATTNNGILNACFPTGDGRSYAGFCYYDPSTYSAQKYGPGITVIIQCLVNGKLALDHAAETEPAAAADVIQVPAEEISDSDLSPQALEMKQRLENQAQEFSKKMMEKAK